jgi:hypothetical protein
MQVMGMDAMSCTLGYKTYQVKKEKSKKFNSQKRARRQVVYVLSDFISH